jgi:hypothetical protein
MEQYTCVLEPFHGGVEIEVGNVHCHELGVGCGDHTVEEALGGDNVSSGSADFARVVNAVAADGEADAAIFLFLWLDFDNDAERGGFVVGWQGSMGNEMHGLSAGLHAVWKSALH